MTNQNTSPSRFERSKRLVGLNGQVISIAAMVIGAGLVAWALLVPTSETQIPFSVHETDAVERLLKDAKLKLPDGTETRSYAVRVEGVASPIAEFVSLGKDGKPASVLSWVNTTAEPVLSPDVTSSEILKVAEAITKHTKADDILIGFPGFVGSIARLTERKALISSGAPLSVIAPAIWHDERSVIVGQQKKFWAAHAKNDEATLNKMVDALLSDELTGTASLAALAKGKRSFLILNIADVMRLGALARKRFYVGYRDFPGVSRAHGLIKAIKGWLSKNGHSSYAVEQRDGDFSRVYFLGKNELKSALIARALPFSTTNPMQLDVLRLVFQTGGTWVFRIEPLKSAS